MAESVAIAAIMAFNGGCPPQTSQDHMRREVVMVGTFNFVGGNYHRNKLKKVR